MDNEKKVDKEDIFKEEEIRHVLKKNNVRMEKTSFPCPELLECQVCEEQYEAKVEIENCVRMFLKLKFGEIFLKFKRKSVKYPKIQKLSMIKMIKNSLPKIDCENCGKTYENLEIREKHIVEECSKDGFIFLNVTK